MALFTRTRIVRMALPAVALGYLKLEEGSC